jgi:hypothetical protein
MDTLSRDKYTRLRINEIRLIKILPASSSDAPIRATLISVDLETAPDYRALSYIWGPEPRGQYSIICDGESIPIRENVSNALHALRYYEEPFAILHQERSGPQCFWIDELCIDQTNIQEKAEQISKMPQIFLRATQTVLVRKIKFLEFVNCCLILPLCDAPKMYKKTVLFYILI